MRVFGKILIPEFQKVVEKAARKNILNPDLSGVKRIEKEEEFPYGRANVEGVEGLVQSVELRQGFDQLGNVILHVLLAKESK